MNAQTPGDSFYAVGKLPHADLLELLHTATGSDPRVIMGPGLGHDAAVIDFGERLLVAKSDPITFATGEIGWYVVNVNANDVACLGAAPRWFVATLLLPAGKTDYDLVADIFAQINAACAALGCVLVGGHTEVTYRVDRPLVVGTMIGEVAPGRLVRSDGARPGDLLLLTKGIAVEGTAILAREARERLVGKAPAAMLERAAGFLHNPGISVVQDAAIMVAAGEVHAMHDPTEGGVATGIWEMVTAAGCGATIAAGALPILEETRLFCEVLDLDPLGLIASGSLLASIRPEDGPTICAALERAGIPVSIIGEVAGAGGVVLEERQEKRRLEPFPRDEIARLFE